MGFEDFSSPAMDYPDIIVCCFMENSIGPFKDFSDSFHGLLAYEKY